MTAPKSARAQLAWKFEFPPESHWFRYRLWFPRDLDAAIAELAKP